MPGVARQPRRSTFGPNYDQLTQIKAEYDSDNTFHVNHNIRPAK